MKIALIGTGKMGRAIEEYALAKGHEIVARFSSKHTLAEYAGELKMAEMAIEFSRPDSVVDNLMACLEQGVPVVCGTTGWLDQFESVRESFIQEKGSLLYASNFSLGVNILFQLNRALAAMMKNIKEYDAEILEVHHSRKVDKPSGTALSLARELIEVHPDYHHWALCDEEDEISPGVLPVRSIREADVIGFHEISWQSAYDRICLQHEAFSRDGFVSGSVMAAGWLRGKIGVFSMEDVLFEKGQRLIV